MVVLTRLFFFYIFSLLSVQVYAVNLKDTVIHRNRDFNSDWKFIRSDEQGAALPGHDDSKWQIVSLPHDYSIVGDHINDNTANIGPFSKDSEGGPFVGYTKGGTAWYRKTFTLTAADLGQLIKVHFDGVYSESEVYLNGHKLGFHPHGYTPFYYELTSFINPAGQKNVLAVKTMNNGHNSRWYAGSGIYRHVHLSVSERLHIDTWGLGIETMAINDGTAAIRLKVNIKNGENKGRQVRVRTELISKAQPTHTKEMVLNLPAGQDTLVMLDMDIKSALLWTFDYPNLYRARISVFSGNRLTDQYEENFGVRTIEFNAEEGFKLNGTVVKLKGANVHHDNGLLGAKAYKAAEIHKVKLLKENGFNAIRTSHNPPSQFFLEACDSLGMFVLDEVFDMWEHAKKPQDYHQYFKEWSETDLKSVILRDRNHPSVMMWSIGNEIYERALPEGVAIAKNLVGLAHRLDPSRPVTSGICEFWEFKDLNWDATALAFQHLDVAGYNYQYDKYETDHQKFPKRIMMGTESYAMSVFDNWEKVSSMPWVIGDFVWTGIDYIGEAGIGHSLIDQKVAGNLLEWPWYNAWCGDIDIIGNKKPQSYYRDVVWKNSLLEIAVRAPLPSGAKEVISNWGWPNEQQSWTWPGALDQELTVAVYADAELIRVELNGKILSEAPVAEGSKFITLIKVKYQPGALKVSALKDGKVIATKVLKTVEEAAGLRLVPDKSRLFPSQEDLSYIQIAAVDAQDNLVPTASHRIKLNISGSGVLESSGNANPTDLTSFGNPELKLYNGRALVIVRTNGKEGEIKVTVSAAGLKTGMAELKVIK